MKRLDLAGKTFGNLVVLRPSSGIHKKAFWECLCGCGKTTVVSADNLKKNNGTKSCGCFRFRAGVDSPKWKGGIHKNHQGYMRVNIGSGARRFEHQIVIEKALGKPIPTSAIPHHIDEDKSNNANNNLVLCENRAYHNLLHRRIRAIAECGNASWLKCCYCKQHDNPDNLYVLNKRGREIGRHVECHKKYMVSYHARRKRAA